MRVLVPWKSSPSVHQDSSDSDQEYPAQEALVQTSSEEHEFRKSEPSECLTEQRINPRGESKLKPGNGANCELNLVEEIETEASLHSSSITRAGHLQSRCTSDTGETSPRIASESTVGKKTAATRTISAISQAQSKKRPRSILTDCKPAAKPTVPISMAGGNRTRRPRTEDASLDRDWETDPLENEPPALTNVITIASPASAPASFSACHTLQGNYPKQHKDLSPSGLAFQDILKNKRGLEIVEQEGDGNCLFRAVSLQVYGDASMHAEVRERCLDFMERDPEHFSPFLAMEDAGPAASTTPTGTDSFATYIARKRHLGVHGNNPEIQAISELFNRPVEVYTPEQGAEPLNIFQTAYKTSDVPIRLAYHDGNHYNAVIDPLVPTAGLGLGLPGLQPGLADKMQVAQAVTESDYLADEMELKQVLKASREDEYKRTLQESASLMDKVYGDFSSGQTDLDAANFELEQKVLANSLDSFRRQEHGRKKRALPIHNRRRQPSPELPDFVSDPAASVAAAAIPTVASLPSTATASAPSCQVTHAQASVPQVLSSADEYPQTVQELVMNGFELRKVVHAYELIGDNFDDLLAFLISRSA